MTLRRRAGRIVQGLLDLRYRWRESWAVFHTRYLADVLFVHINKTAGSSIERALGLPFQHRTARELRELVGGDRWEARFSFAFVRNPWDKVASHYHYRVQTDQTGLGDGETGFNEWVIRAYGEKDPAYYDNPKMFMPQVDWVSNAEGKVIVDFIGRFERLEEDFARVCDAIGAEASLPHLKASDHRDYRRLYSDEAASVVERHFAPDLERFRYEF